MPKYTSLKKCAYLFLAERNDNEVVVEQAVPIGTKLQLRASINTDSGTYMIALTVKYYYNHPKILMLILNFSLEIRETPRSDDVSRPTRHVWQGSYQTGDQRVGSLNLNSYAELKN